MQKTSGSSRLRIVLAITLLAPWSLTIRTPLAVSIASCRHPIQLLSDLGEEVICREITYGLPNRLYFSRENGAQVLRLPKTLRPRIPFQHPNGTPLQSNARRPSRNRRSRRRPVQPTESNTIVCLDFVSMTFLQQGGASWLRFVQLVLILVRHKLLRRVVGRNMVLIAVGTVPAGSKPPAADDSMRTSTGGRCGFGASAPC